MSTKAVIRAWYSVGSQYIFWGSTQISDPLFEYPTGAPGYPATNLLSDFVLLDYEGEFGTHNGTVMEGTWDLGVSDGYAVYVDSVSSDIKLGLANSYSTSRVVGVAFATTNEVVTLGEYETYCDGTVDSGKPVYLSPTISGAVTATAPKTASQTRVVVGTSSEAKVTTNLDKVKVIISPKEPIELEETIEI